MVVVTGPMTNLALVLQKEPTLVHRISAIYAMGTNYNGLNNVYDWQMTWNNRTGSCLEETTTTMPVPVVPQYYPTNAMYPFVSSPGHYPTEDEEEEEEEPIRFRSGCRGNNMSVSGDTEWNVFLDVYAWHIVSRIVAEASISTSASTSSLRRPVPKFYVLLSHSATEDMPITMQDFSNGLNMFNNNNNNNNKSNLDTDKVPFITNLAENFLAAGEAKWWDAQLVVAMADIITGVAHKDSVCSVWKETTGFDINLEWNRVTKEEGRKESLRKYYG